jgi:hypothetical protein
VDIVHTRTIIFLHIVVERCVTKHFFHEKRENNEDELHFCTKIFLIVEQ